MCEWFACMYVCVSCAYLVPMKVRQRHQIPWVWSYRWLWTTIWAQKIESRFFVRTNALNCWVIFSAPYNLLLMINNENNNYNRQGWEQKTLFHTWLTVKVSRLGLTVFSLFLHNTSFKFMPSLKFHSSTHIQFHHLGKEWQEEQEFIVNIGCMRSYLNKYVLNIIFLLICF